MKKVRLVTPTRRNTSSVAAFEDELLNHFGWAEDIDYDVYAANDDLTKLNTKVTAAVGETPDVIVSAGFMTTGLLQAATATIPVIQAAGGDDPKPKPANITGFTLDTLGKANKHLGKFTGAGRNVTVLYNDQNTTSVWVKNHLTIPGNVTPNYLPIHDPTGFVRPALPWDGFILIPDAMFYKYHRKIVAMVEGTSETYYPERLFKNAHESKKRSKSTGTTFRPPFV